MSQERDFFAGLDLMDSRVQEGARVGMGRALMQWMDDSINKVPRIPHDEGSLQGSYSAFVGKKRIGVAQSVGGQPNPAMQFTPDAAKDELVGSLGNNAPYAAYQHEGQRADGSRPVNPANYTRQDGRGPKFQERALEEFSDDYMSLIAEGIRETLGKG